MQELRIDHVRSHDDTLSPFVRRAEIHEPSRDIITRYHQRFVDVALYAKAQFQRPRAYGIRLTMDGGAKWSRIVERIMDRYRKPGKGRSKNSTFMPLICWVREIKEFDEDGTRHPDGYEHYHCMLILEGKYAKAEGLKLLLHTLQGQGLLYSYWESKAGKTEKHRVKVHDLSSIEGFEDYLEHCEYFSKVETKEKTPGKRNHGSSVLRKPFRERLQQLREQALTLLDVA
jgi:hypothetical protein